MKHGNRPQTLGETLRRTFSVRERIARAALRLIGIAQVLDRRPANAYPYSGLEMWRLYIDMRRRKPETVMEFGVGCSTIAIAVALHKNGRGRLITVDASQEWVEVCQAGLPEHLRGLVEFVHSPVEPIPGERAHRYTLKPEVALDYLFIDGPSVQHVPHWEGPPIAADPILPEMRFNPGARIMVEGRPKNVEFLKERLGPEWRMRKDRTLALSWVSFDKAR